MHDIASIKNVCENIHVTMAYYLGEKHGNIYNLSLTEHNTSCISHINQKLDIFGTCLYLCVPFGFSYTLTENS